MKTFIRLAALIVLAAVLVSGSDLLAAGENPPVDVNLDFNLPVPEDAAAAAYLGVDSPGQFTLDQVDADILIVEIFSMYCPICQQKAPQVNILFEKLKAVQDKRIRLLGIGAGNSAYEVAFFKKTYAIPFPLFSDGDFAIHKKIGEPGTPFFIALKPGAPKGRQIFFTTHSGEIGDLDLFFQQLTRAPD